MKIYAPCEGCWKETGKKRWFVRKRTYITPRVSTPITSQALLCGKCYRGIKKLIKTL